MLSISSFAESSDDHKPEVDDSGVPIAPRKIKIKDSICGDLLTATKKMTIATDAKAKTSYHWGSYPGRGNTSLWL